MNSKIPFAKMGFFMPFTFHYFCTMGFNHWDDTIVAIATGQSGGSIAILRLSGQNAIAICSKLFTAANLADKPTHTLHYGSIADANNVVIDEVVVGLYKNPKSYTGEDVVEISCHNSPYIVQQILQLCMANGARLAKAGEFTQRAYLNGKLDLAQAEAVADLIASESAAQHKMALTQLKGGVSNEIKEARTQLLNFTSLLELELDFAEEDVEFADRTQLKALLVAVQQRIQVLLQSFKLGNAIKKGIPTVIIGKPNTGKSTLLNALLQEDRAIVSNIPGTTRDTIEELINIDGVLFKIIDTAGIRVATDAIEQIGVSKAKEKAATAQLLIYLVDAIDFDAALFAEGFTELYSPTIPTIVCINKIDAINPESVGVLHNTIAALLPITESTRIAIMAIAAKTGQGVTALQQQMLQQVGLENIATTHTLISNERHYNVLRIAHTSLQRVANGLQHHQKTDLLAFDLRECLNALGEISGQFTNDEVLGNIFSKFCIGK